MSNREMSIEEYVKCNDQWSRTNKYKINTTVVHGVMVLPQQRPRGTYFRSAPTGT